MIVKNADILGISIDYVVGNTNIELDRNTSKRLDVIVTHIDENNLFIYRMIDMAFRYLQQGRITKHNKFIRTDQI